MTGTLPCVRFAPAKSLDPRPRPIHTFAMARASATRRKKRLLRATTAAAVLAVTVAVLLVKATPDVYERTVPMGPDRQAFRAFNRRVVNHAGNVLLDESGGTRLDLAVTEAMVNARIAVFLAEERQGGRPVPEVLERLRVGFEPGAVVLAARLGEGWSQVVLAQWLHLSADEKGRLVAEPAGTRAGRLPLPGGVLGLLRTAAADVLDPDEPADRPDAAPGETTARATADEHVRLVDAILDALAGRPVPLGKGKRRIVLECVEVDRGVLRMTGRRAEEMES